MARLLDKVIGHQLTIQHLLHAIEKDHMHSTLMFVGPSGVGKRLTALGVAQALICPKSAAGCGECGACQRVANQQSESLMVVEPEKGAVKIDQARAITKFLSVRQFGQARVVIINEAQHLNPQAANALLKVLEEPPEGTYFILVASGAFGVLPTVRSRSQVVRFRPLSKEELSQVVPAEPWMLEAAQGRIDIVEQIQQEDLAEHRKSAFRFWELLLEDNPLRALDAVRGLWRDREESLFVIRCWQQILRDALFFQQGLKGIIHSDHMDLLESLAERPQQALLNIAQMIQTLEADLRGNVDRSLSFETFCLHSEEILGA